MAKILLVISVFLHAVVLYSQPVLKEKDLKGAKNIKIRSFYGESLYGYIDGGADLYLEYGFSDVTVTEFIKAKSKYKVEIYRMTGPEAAFGIFSVSRFRCLYRPTFAALTCQNKFQLQVCKGSYYINIINETGSSADSAVSASIAMKLVPEIKDNDINPADYFALTDTDGMLNNAYLVKGPLGIQNSIPGTEKYLAEARNYTALMCRAGDFLKIAVIFKSDEDFKGFLQKVTAGGSNNDAGELMSVWNIPFRVTGLNRLSFDIPVAEPDN